MSCARRRAGMSLVEGLLYAGLSVLVLGGISSLMVQTSRMEDRTDQVAAEVVEVARLYRRVLKDVSRAVPEEVELLDQAADSSDFEGLRIAVPDDDHPGTTVAVEYHLDPTTGVVERREEGADESHYGLGPGAVLAFRRSTCADGSPAASLGLRVEVDHVPEHPGRAIRLDARLPFMLPSARFSYWN